jgi:hypothetical protein
MIETDRIQDPISKEEILKFTMDTFENYITQELEFECKEDMFKYQQEVFGYFYMVKNLIDDIYR